MDVEIREVVSSSFWRREENHMQSPEIVIIGAAIIDVLACPVSTETNKR